jgi:2-polyprenyl-3-methyl-5-hydroxy-6-metoxy-1,4-benzoquinol methylase
MDDNTEKVTQVFDMYASAYEQRHMQVTTYHSSLDTFCNLLPHRKASLLEIGCGPGNITAYILSKQSSLDVFGIDLSPNMIELAKANNPSASFAIMDGRNIDQLNKSFDSIVCGFILPYISKEEVLQLIINANNLLSSEGIIYLSTMEDDYENSEIKGPSSGKGPSLKMYYYQEEQLLELLTNNGFKHLHTERHPIDGSEREDLVLIARKG